MEHTICHFEIPADDLDAARAFYGELFGWSIVPAPGEGEPYLFIRPSQRPDSLGGGLLRRVEPGHGPTIYVAVESIDESVKKLEELGGTVLVPKTALPKLGWVATGKDPQGNPIGLFEQLAPEGAPAAMEQPKQGDGGR